MCHAVWLLLLDEFLDVFDLQIWNMLLCTHVDTKKTRFIYAGLK